MEKPTIKVISIKSVIMGKHISASTFPKQTRMKSLLFLIPHTVTQGPVLGRIRYWTKEAFTIRIQQKSQPAKIGRDLQKSHLIQLPPYF